MTADEPELPRDPDLDAVPMAAEVLDGQEVVVTDPETGEQLRGTFYVTPSVIAAYGDARRAREQRDGEA